MQLVAPEITNRFEFMAECVRACALIRRPGLVPLCLGYIIYCIIYYILLYYVILYYIILYIMGSGVALLLCVSSYSDPGQVSEAIGLRGG